VPTQDWFESHAAKTQPRFALFRAARLAYEDYIRDSSAMGRPGFPKLKEIDFRRAASDTHLLQAEQLYLRALALSRQEKVFRDTAVALYQLGMLYHLQGRLAESREALEEALDIADSLPHLEDPEIKLISGCCYHLGILAAREGRTDLAKTFLNRSVNIDDAFADVYGQALSSEAIDVFFGQTANNHTLAKDTRDQSTRGLKIE
jgi:tetratricopeptide (TPR) repeat protein